MLNPTCARLAGLAALLCIISPAAAQSEEAEAGRTSALVVYGDDPCPKSEEGEIVVCARKPESERYRIPKALRENKQDRGEMSWGARVADLDEASRVTRPGGCSAVGSFGQTGCFEQMIRNWSANRRADQEEAAGIP